MMIGADRSVAAAPEEARAEPVDHPFALAIGPSAERDVGSGPAQLGAEASFEADLIEHWLEVEAGVQWLVGAGGHQLSVDVLVKKPFQLGRTLSMMVGMGPQVVRSVVRSDGGHVTRTDVGLEVAVDVMWWVFTDKVGLGFEPSYGLTFGPTQQSVGLTVGPIFGW